MKWPGLWSTQWTREGQKESRCAGPIVEMQDGSRYKAKVVVGADGVMSKVRFAPFQSGGVRVLS